LIAEKANPVADIAYFGGQFGPQARAAEVLAPYKPARFNDIPAGMKDPDGYWFTIHSGTLGLFVNTAALRGKPVPQSWSDLLKPDYKGLVGYLNPASAAVGQVGVIAVNLALGGSYENLDPGIKFFGQLRANQPIVPTDSGACYPARSRSCSTTTSTPIAPSTRTALRSRSRFRPRARSSCRTSWGSSHAGQTPSRASASSTSCCPMTASGTGQARFCGRCLRPR
jgi:hypothetical protein